MSEHWTATLGSLHRLPSSERQTENLPVSQRDREYSSDIYFPLSTGGERLRLRVLDEIQTPSMPDIGQRLARAGHYAYLVSDGWDNSLTFATDGLESILWSPLTSMPQKSLAHEGLSGKFAVHRDKIQLAVDRGEILQDIERGPGAK